MTTPRVCIVGGGAAGMVAALYAAWNGSKVTILERNDRLGLKLSITGKGRCNLTNDCSVEALIANCPGNGRFLHSAFRYLDSQGVMSLFTQLGLNLKVERGNRVFPESDNSGDVLQVLSHALREAGVSIVFKARVAQILTSDGHVSGVACTDGRVFDADKVIVATGGASYPRTGSSGDGYKLASAVGHSVVPLKPALIPLEVQEEWVRDVQGLALKNVEVRSACATEFGEMLFTHFGLSGPIILTLSSSIVPALNAGPLSIYIDLKPALTSEQLDARILRDFSEQSRKYLGNSLGGLLPSSLIPVVVRLSGIPQDKPVHQVTKAERDTLVQLMKGLPLTVTAPRPLEEAIVTSGGVQVKEITPKTMESKLVKGLYLCGEIIDVDGYTGGFNLQIAWSTGALAGYSAALS